MRLLISGSWMKAPSCMSVNDNVWYEWFMSY